MTPALVRPLVDGIPDAEWAVFENSAHIAMAGEPDRYREVAQSFLARVEASKGQRTHRQKAGRRQT
jgi:pimeloyl-ACP methyl ester carboxylesterase